jgi:hypothetical protein
LKPDPGPRLRRASLHPSCSYAQLQALPDPMLRSWRKPGRPEEFHHQSPTEPYVNLSAHTARASHSLGASRHQADKERDKLLPDFWLAITPSELTHPLRSILITRTSSLLRDDPPPSCASILSPFVGPPLIGFSLTITRRVPTFHTRA